MLKKLDDHITNPYRGTHTVFRHARENSDVTAQFAVRRVFVGQSNEHTQMETSVETRHRTRTSSQHSSVLMAPADAREFALAIAPELGSEIEQLRALLKEVSWLRPGDQLSGDWLRRVQSAV